MPPSQAHRAVPRRSRTSETKSVYPRGCSRGRHMETRPGRIRWRPGCQPLPAAVRRGRRRNGRRWPAALRHRGFRRFCRASGGSVGWRWRAKRRDDPATHVGRQWPTPPRGGPGRYYPAGRFRPRRSAATWAVLARRLCLAPGRPFDPGLRPVSPPVRPALPLALRARRNRRILPEIRRVLGGSIPPGSILLHTPGLAETSRTSRHL